MNQSYSTDLGLGQFPETKNSQFFPDMLRVYNALRLIQGKLDQYTGNVPPSQANFSQPSPVRLLATATVAITAGSLLNFQVPGTTLQAQLADPTLVLIPQGIALKPAAIGAQVEILHFGTTPALFTGLVPGTVYYSGPAGTLSAAPVGPPVGMAISTTAIFFKP